MQLIGLFDVQVATNKPDTIGLNASKQLGNLQLVIDANPVKLSGG